jgi:magnesium-transporting ATPase (P-type)
MLTTDGTCRGAILDDDSGTVMIAVRRAPSSTDTLRRSSEPRILSQADLRFAQEVDSENREDLLHRLDKDPVNIEEDFKYNLVGLTSEEGAKRLTIYGPNQLPEKTIPKWYIFVQQLWQPMPCLIWIAAIIEAGIQNWIDMGILLLIQVRFDPQLC